MKGTLVTEENYNRICGRLQKFFKHHDFVVWHTFDSGFKKRNPTLCRVMHDHKKYNVTRYYYIGTNQTFDESDNIRLGVYFNNPQDGGFIVKPGMTIWFLGNRITIKSEASALLEFHWLYQTFQIDK